MEAMDVDTDRRDALPSVWVDAGALAGTLVLFLLVVIGVEGPVRVALSLAFFTFVPGWAIVTNWEAAAETSRVALPVLLSLAISVAASTVTLWLHVWDPLVLFSVVAAISAAAIGSRVVRRLRAAR